jgi:hypothetical protein
VVRLPALRAGHCFTPPKTLFLCIWYSFLLETESTTGLSAANWQKSQFNHVNPGFALEDVYWSYNRNANIASTTKRNNAEEDPDKCQHALGLNCSVELVGSSSILVQQSELRQCNHKTWQWTNPLHPRATYAAIAVTCMLHESHCWSQVIQTEDSFHIPPVSVICLWQ